MNQNFSVKGSMDKSRCPASSSLLSVVVPVYNNADTLRELASQLIVQANSLFGSIEILFVNDGSRDDSGSVIDSLCEEIPAIRGIHFTRNFGQHTAMMAGLQHASGDYILLIDADLEEDPAMLPKFVSALAGDIEIVLGLRSTRRTSFFKHWTAKLYYELNNFLCDYPVQRDATNMRLMTRSYRNHLLSFSERPFLGGFTTWVGLPVALVPIPWQDQGRTSEFTFRKLSSHARLGVIAFSSKLLRISSLFGLILSVGSSLYGLFLLFRFLTAGTTVPGFYTTAVLGFFSLGMCSIFLGILGEYVADIHEAVKKRPVYLIRSVTNLPAVQASSCAE
jgi:dolichol-phosphate mannosyltransferase